MTDITLSRVEDFAALGDRWRRLEARSDCSFFQSWTWTGCLAQERFPDPILVEATEAGETVALALFNRRRHRFGADTLFLGETGIAALDRPYIEDNGVLCIAGRTADLTTACLRAARFARLGGRRPWPARRLVINGIDDATLAATRQVAGSTWVRHSDPAPYVEILQPERENSDYLARRSANTRQQLRRSDRSYAESGALTLQRAASPAEAHRFLDEMAVLHQARWVARGEPGSFADPFFGRFHHALVERGLPRGEIALLRITAGTQVIGILYNFRFRERMLAYQSGFDYAGPDRRRKPGMTCHHQAIQSCRGDTITVYDFLAGGDRYKYSLADGIRSLHWLDVAHGGSPRDLWRRANRWLAGYGCTLRMGGRQRVCKKIVALRLMLRHFGAWGEG